MADIRDFAFSEETAFRGGRVAPFVRLVARTQTLVRAVVVATAFPPFRQLYAAIYRAHIAYAKRRLGALPGVRAVYLARGAASSDVVYGVSDIDLFVVGEFGEGEQERAVNEMRRLSRISPLFDAANALQVHTPESLHSLYATDYLFQFRWDQGRRQYKLLAGENVLRDLPPLPQERVRGGYLMELKLWWMLFVTSAFATGPTHRDRIFRNANAYKTAVETLNMRTAMEGGEVELSRPRALARAEAGLNEEDRRIARRLARCRERRFQRYDGDVLDDSLALLLRNLEAVHAGLPEYPPFQPVAGARLVVDAPAAEMFRTAPAEERVETVLRHVKANWSGYRAAYLLPRNSLSGVDDLQLLLDVDPAQAPSAREVRALCALDDPPGLRQRVALYLLLPNAAYLMERRNRLEFWRMFLSPVADPEIFSLLGREAYVIDGTARPERPYAWTQFNRSLITQELGLRRAAMAKAAFTAGRLNPLFVLRGIWRHLQLEVIDRAADTGTVRVPLTVGAIRRGIGLWGLPDTPILEKLEQAYADEIAGRPSRASQLIPQAVAFFSRVPALQGGAKR